jgi:hypothetical protein
MRRLSLALLSLAPLVLGASARAVPLELQAGVTAGWTFGRGFTVGPVLSGGRHLVTGRPFNTSWDTSLIGGVVLAGDVTLGATATPPTFHLHVGPEVAALHGCPVYFLPVSAGVGWSFAKGRPARIAGTGSVAFLLSWHAAPTYVHPAPAPTITLGPTYRLSIASPTEVEHTLGAESRALLYPYVGVGYCGGD